MKMNRYIICGVVSAMCLTSPQLFANTEKLSIDKNNIKVWTYEDANNPIFSYKATTTLNAPMEKAIAMVLDVQKTPEWVPNLAKVEVLSQDNQKGDFVLQEISKVLKNRTNRASDFAFRIGGEEFAILVNLEKNKISEFAEAIKNDIENLKIEHSGNKVSKYVTTSIGVNFKQADELKNIDELFKVADDNLYEAKRSGRNCVVIK